MLIIGQGSKVCPFVDRDNVQKPHIKASQEDLSGRLQQEKQLRVQESTSLHCRLLEKTFAYFTSIRRLGCTGSIHEPSLYTGQEAEAQERRMYTKERAQRGHPNKPTCEGRLLFDYNSKGQGFIRCVTAQTHSFLQLITESCRCEHYSRLNPDHLIDYNASNGLYDNAYLEALFIGDSEAIEEVEEEMAVINHTGPLSKCSTVSNFTALKVHCCA